MEDEQLDPDIDPKRLKSGMEKLKNGVFLSRLTEHERRAVETYRDKVEYLRRWKRENPGWPRKKSDRERIKECVKLQIVYNLESFEAIAQRLATFYPAGKCPSYLSIKRWYFTYPRYWVHCIAEVHKDLHQETMEALYAARMESLRRNMKMLEDVDRNYQGILDAPINDKNMMAKVKAGEKVREATGFGVSSGEGRAAGGPLREDFRSYLAQNKDIQALDAEVVEDGDSS